MKREILVKDAERMEEISCRTAERSDIWQDRFIYWMAVAILALLKNELGRKEK